MFTFGPVNDTPRELVARVVSDHLGSNLRGNVIAMEVSNTGYHHCHVAVDLSTPTKPSMKLVKKLKSLCIEDCEGRKPNCGVHYVPTSESRGKSAYSVLSKYLRDPKKIKWTDEGALTFVTPPYVPGDAPTICRADDPVGYCQQFILYIHKRVREGEERKRRFKVIHGYEPCRIPTCMVGPQKPISRRG